MSFVEKLNPKALEFFNEVAAKPFAGQAQAFLNAYWTEVGSQAEFIFCFAYEVIKYADMHAKGVNYIHLYEEGNDLDFNIGLYFYEKLCQRLGGEGKEWAAAQYKMSQPELVTAIVRKKELREKVDVNFDGRISFLEYLLYQYREFANPSDFAHRSMNCAPPPDPAILAAAQLAMEEVNKRIKAYEAEKQRLEEGALLPGVKGLKFKNLLAQLGCSPLKEELSTALIKAEAAVRIAIRGSRVKVGNDGPAPIEGTLWWMNRDIEDKKKRYGR